MANKRVSEKNNPLTPVFLHVTLQHKMFMDAHPKGGSFCVRELLDRALQEEKAKTGASPETEQCVPLSTCSTPRKKELLLVQKRRSAHRIKSPKEWERENKLSYLMQYAAAGQLKRADEERIAQKMKLGPDMVIGWLHSPTPEHISPDLLEKARCHNWGSLPNLQSLKEQNKIDEPFYRLLMMWLNLPTKEDVARWIISGAEAVKEHKAEDAQDKLTQAATITTPTEAAQEQEKPASEPVT